MTQKTLKMVKGQTYSCPQLPNGGVVQLNGTIAVDAPLADALLADSYFDGLNNEHFYFKEVDGTEEAEDTDETEVADAGKAAAPKAAARRSRTK